MVVQEMAEAEYNVDKKEIQVFCKHSFSGRGKRIIGAVTVLFIQCDDKLTLNGDVPYSESKSTSEKSHNTKIPTSLSIINLPQFPDVLTGPKTALPDQNIIRTDLGETGSSDKSFSDFVSKKFIENLNSSEELGNDLKNLTEQKDECQEKSDIAESNKILASNDITDLENNKFQDESELETNKSLDQDGSECNEPKIQDQSLKDDIHSQNDKLMCDTPNASDVLMEDLHVENDKMSCDQLTTPDVENDKMSCDQLTTPDVQNDKMSCDQLTTSDVQNDKISCDQQTTPDVQNDKMSCDQLTSSDVQNDKMSNDQLTSSDVQNDKISCDQLTTSDVQNNKVSSDQLTILDDAENCRSMKNNSNDNDKVNVDPLNISVEMEIFDCKNEEIRNDTQRKNFGSQTRLKNTVDAATNTNKIVNYDLSSKNYVDASTNTSIEEELITGSPLKRKRTETVDSKESVESENEATSMFIITESRSLSEEDSGSQDSLEVCSNLSQSSSIIMQTSKNPFSDLNRTNQTQDTRSPVSSDFIVIRGNDMDTVDRMDIDQNAVDYRSPSDVSIVDLSDVAVPYVKLQPESMTDNLPVSSSNETTHKTRPTFYNQNVSVIKPLQELPESQTSMFHPSGSQRQKIFRSTSVSKTSFKGEVEKCKICKRSLTSLADMFHHSKIHNIGIKCCVCGMKAFDWNVMKHHYTWHIQRNSFKCSQCSTIFASRDLLAAHMKTHTAAKSLVHLKSPKLHPPASKLILSQPRDGHHLPNVSVINRQMSNQNYVLSSANKPGGSFGRRKFTPVRRQTTPATEAMLQSNQNQRTSPNTSNQYHTTPSTKTVNVNQILNYSCGCCDEKFVNVEKLKRHVLMYHSEETMSDSRCTFESQSNAPFSMFGASSSDLAGSAASSSSALTFTSDNSGMIQIKQEQDPEIIDIEQLGKFTENMENSRSTTSSDQFSVGINQISDQLEQEVMSSFLETTSDKHSPTSQQRKSACRLANVIPVCRFCGVYLNNWSEILEHRFSHPEEIGQQLACTVCSSVLSTRDSLKRHAINHMGIRHQCHFCHHEYSRKDSLMTHMKSVHGFSNHA